MAVTKIVEHDMQSGEYAAAEDIEVGVLRSDAEQWLDRSWWDPIALMIPY